ncbi:MAG: GGDEF domain-containing protein, partial [Candidatus Magnetoovum sp. WYHC-5]|nr:GGDEF domain-containing protein [Candidatus Magnetoovum sp. WYHC-5]
YDISDVVGKDYFSGIIRYADGMGINVSNGDDLISKVMLSGVPETEEVFLYNKEKKKVPVILKVNPVEDDKGQRLGAIAVFIENAEKIKLERQFTKLRSLNLIDPLTELGNRKYAEINLKARFNEWMRYGWPFGLIFLSIDHIERISSTIGKVHGNNIIKIVAGALAESVRPYDTISRWDESEFTMILANVNEDTLPIIAERSRRIAETCKYKVNERAVPIFVSIGATLAKKKETIFQLRSRAQQLMEISKKGGGNKITLDDEIKSAINA